MSPSDPPVAAEATLRSALEELDLAAPENVGRLLLDFQQMSEYVNDPLIIERAEGVRYWDVRGKEYLDGISGIYVVNVGHRNPRVVAAIKQQLDTLSFAPPLHAANPAAIRLASLLAEIAPGDLKTVKLLSGGSEATEVAIKLSLQFHRQTGNPAKYKIISRYKGYHGATLGALGATGTSRRRKVFEPLLPNFLRVHPPHCYRCPYEKTYPDCEVYCARTVEQTIEMEDPSTVAAVIVEPITNTGGIITPPPEYFPILRRVCDRHNVLLIFDEVITGFGRTGEMFAAQTFQTVPDLICAGKGMGSGYGPLAAVLVSNRVAAAFWGPQEAELEFAHGHTFGGNPLSAAAGVASILEILERGLLDNCRRMGAYLRQKLEALAPYRIVGEVRGRGLMLGVELVRNPETREPFPPAWNVGGRIAKAALRHGLIIRADQDWFALAPPLIVTPEDIDEMLVRLEAAIEEVMAAPPVRTPVWSNERR